MLSIKNLEVYYGYVCALKGISVEVEEGEITCLLGSNGAGKSTTLQTISGLVKPRSGSIKFRDKEISREDSSRIVSLGIVQCPEGRQLFHAMTVHENLMAGAYKVRSKSETLENRSMVYELFPILAERRRQAAGTLSGGEQQMLAIGRALMASPSLLMLDEPSLGLAPKIVEQIFDLLVRLNKEKNLTILLVEQNANAALKISSFAYILETGSIGLQGPSAELASNDLVRAKYLGA
ncbi:MAG TPA: ABC transporter ATP-binding protein [Mesotoga infera]|nr:ABC transporter ATP-binding protein [Mesotoga sp.]HON28678.1 ABC transporter ATP-binding protein [Mesotoga infera]HPD39050.1 ABC transporter ATP-binding protein [Mesotoga infera]HRR45141.1 ABC transporter ATP-binding protein [Mesotoga sp.]HRV02557.1 ABC transporter ATP-binding protein [Mesotoga sp.]